MKIPDTLRKWLLGKVLNDHNPTGPEQVAGGHHAQRTGGEAAAIGRIQKNDIEAFPLTGETRQDAQHVTGEHPVLPQAGRLDVLPEHAQAGRILLEKDNLGTATAQGLDADCPRPGVQVKKSNPPD